MNQILLPDRIDETSGGGCPDAERLACYIDGGGASEERAQIEAHVATCEDCYSVLVETLQEERERPAIPSPNELTVKPSQPWITGLTWAGAGVGIAAALILTVQMVVGPRTRVGTDQQLAASNPSPQNNPSRTPGAAQPSNPAVANPQLESLAAALNALETATGDYRPLRPRLADGFQYRPLKPVTRSAAGLDEAPLNVREAALAVEAAAAAPGTGIVGQRTRAAMYLITDKPRNAVAILGPMAAASGDASLLTDAAAAYLARDEQGDAQRALDLATRAVAADPKRAEAWFNLALAAEALDLSPRATEAWTKYLEIDGTSGWAKEARQHLDRLNRRPRR